ncbi:MAG TPA: glycosyltransferase family A protein [Methylomirabilota bacterium]|nr:glycosyltransferase family A protein [Methylomirabilota bacterium]
MPKAFASVLIDTYNHERFIAQAIESVLEQDFPTSEREIIVVDDGSTDGTPEIVRQFAPQVRLLRKENGGQASAFNAGIPECKGEIVAFLDGDDWWTAGKLRAVSEALEKNASVGIVGHGIVNVQRNGSEQVETLREGFRFRADTMEGARLLQRRGAFLGTSRMTIRTEVLRTIGAIPEAIRVQADEYLFTLAAALAGAQILPEALTFYRMHDANSFQITGNDLQKLRRKQESLAALANGLMQRLERLGIEPRVRRVVVAYPQASADQLRLMLNGGWPWQTVKTEWKVYEVVHPDAPLAHRLFKRMVLLGALFVPPKSFYGAQRKLAQSEFYRRVRARLLPVPEMQHIQRDWRARS